MSIMLLLDIGSAVQCCTTSRFVLTLLSLLRANISYITTHFPLQSCSRMLVLVVVVVVMVVIVLVVMVAVVVVVMMMMMMMMMMIMMKCAVLVWSKRSIISADVWRDIITKRILGLGGRISSTITNCIFCTVPFGEVSVLFTFFYIWFAGPNGRAV